MKKSLFLTLAIAMFVFVQPVSAALTDGLVGHWDFDNDSGNIATDSSGQNNHGTIIGATLTEDRFGNSNKAYLFDGGDYIDVPNADSLNPTSAITITAWFKATSFHYGSYSWPNIVSKRDHDGAPTRGYCMEIQAVYSNNPCAGFGVILEGGGGGVPVGWGPFTPELEENTWYFVAGVYDGSAATVYVGPSVAYSENYSGNIVPSSDNLWISNAPVYGDRAFHGVIDDVRIYNRALTADEVIEVYNVPAPGAFMLGGIGVGFVSWLRRRRVL